eukprot:2018560-Pleurochrysis_carterae.AAC.1
MDNLFPPDAASMLTACRDAVQARKPAAYHSAINKAKSETVLLADAARILAAPAATSGHPTTRAAASGGSAYAPGSVSAVGTALAPGAANAATPTSRTRSTASGIPKGLRNV